MHERTCERLGIDAKGFFDCIARSDVQHRLRANTDKVAAARGALGSPTTFVGGDDMYFGNDRLPLMRDPVIRRESR